MCARGFSLLIKSTKIGQNWTKLILISLTLLILRKMAGNWLDLVEFYTVYPSRVPCTQHILPDFRIHSLQCNYTVNQHWYIQCVVHNALTLKINQIGRYGCMDGGAGRILVFRPIRAPAAPSWPIRTQSGPKFRTIGRLERI